MEDIYLLKGCVNPVMGSLEIPGRVSNSHPDRNLTSTVNDYSTCLCTVDGVAVPQQPDANHSCDCKWLLGNSYAIYCTQVGRVIIDLPSRLLQRADPVAVVDVAVGERVLSVAVAPVRPELPHVLVARVPPARPPELPEALLHAVHVVALEPEEGKFTARKF